MRSLLLAVAVVAALHAVPDAVAQQRFLPRVDEAAGDMSWLDFKARLLRALGARDHRQVLSMVDGGVFNAAGEKDGIAAFRATWGLDGKDGGRQSPLFNELPRILALGGAYLAAPNKERWFCAPYVFTAWPVEVDKFDHGAVIATGVLAKQAPTHDAPTVAQLAHEIVRVEDWDLGDAHPAMTQRWVRVLLGGKPAFIPEEHVRSAIEHHACFAKRGGLWKLVQMRAGG
jgi:hypothetical protein